MNERKSAEQFESDLNYLPDRDTVTARVNTSGEYRQLLSTASRLQSASPAVDPAFRLSLEKRLRERAREQLPRQARRTSVQHGLNSALRMGLAAVLLLAFIIGLGWIFRNLKPVGVASQSTPTQPQQLTPIPLIQPSSVPVSAVPDLALIEMRSSQSDYGIRTTYFAKEWQQEHGPAYISAIAIAPDGSVWVGTSGGAVSMGTGVYRFDGQAWTRYSSKNDLPVDETSSIAASPDGALWLGTFCCGLVRFDGKNWATYTTDSGLPGSDIRSLLVAPDGALWLGTVDKGIIRFDGQVWQDFTMENSGLWGNDVGQGIVMPDGSLLFVTRTSWPHLSRFDGSSWSKYAPQGAPGNFSITAIVSTPDDTLWFASSDQGVFSLKDGSWNQYTTQDGLVSDYVNNAVVASDGSLWFGTQKGLSRFDGTSWATFTTADGLANNWITALAAAPDGSIWVGTAGGVTRFTPPAAPEPTSTPPGSIDLQSSHDDIRALMFNPAWQTLWVQGQTTIFTPAGAQDHIYMQAWLDRTGTGRLLSTGNIPGSVNFTLDMAPRYVWVSDGSQVTQFDAQLPPDSATQILTNRAGGLHPLEQIDPVLSMIFPGYLLIRSEDLQPLRMDVQAAQLALVADLAYYRIWIDAQTGLILRSQTLGADGSIVSETQITAILYDPLLPDSALSVEGIDLLRFDSIPKGAQQSTAVPDTGN